MVILYINVLALGDELQSRVNAIVCRTQSLPHSIFLTEFIVEDTLA